MKHPRLYKKTSTGADQYWEIETVGPKIITRFGQVGGKEQVAEDVIKEGKNLGRSNATTPTEQAELEAASQWEKKLKKGYVKTIAAASSGKVDSLITGGIFPMLAHKFRDHAAKILYPAFAQPKLDGHRCIAMPNGTLWSRTRKPIVSVPHIQACVAGLSKDYALDGELYNHDYRNHFEDLTSLIRPAYAKSGHEVVQYHVYDVVNNMPFSDRIEWLRRNIGNDSGYPVQMVETIEVANEDELMAAFESFTAQGYEGAMVRNADGLYVNKRSVDLLKIKEMDDAEFEIIGVKEGRGKLAGHAIFACEVTRNGRAFDVKLKGQLSELKKFLLNPKLAVGKMLTVQYQGMTNSGVPRFPIGLRIREDV